MRNLMLILAITMMTACNNKSSEQLPYHNKDFKVPNGKMTPETLWAFGRIGDVCVSPNGNILAYTVSWYNVAENKSYREIYVQNAEGGETKCLTNTPDVREHSVAWRPDGEKICYISTKSGRSQIWEMNTDGTNQRIVSDIEGDIESYLYSPDIKHVVYTKTIKVLPSVQDKYPDLDKANARIIDDLMYRHWDKWTDGEFSHIFITPYVVEGSKLLKEGIDIMQNEPWESPVAPHGGIEQLAWSKDGKKLAYTCRKKKGKEYTLSTNSDIYLYDLELNNTENLSEGNMGYDKNPVFSHSGNMIAWESMERDGYEADVNRLCIYNFVTKEKYIHPNEDLNISSISWDNSDENIFFIANWHARDHIYRFNLLSKTISQITTGDYDYTMVQSAGNMLITTRMSISKPVEIYSVNPENGVANELSFVNKPILDQLKMGKVEERWVKTTDNKDMLVWVIYPPGFDPQKKYPALLYCQGGPQGTVSQFWSYRWNFQIMAANDYVIVAPNRRGLPGFGKEWNEQISGDYGGQNIRDYLSAIDAISKEPYIDADRLGAVGASYGGFSVLYLAGNHNNRFKAFISHCGMFNFEAKYLETEELWFPNFDIGGPFWEKDNFKAQRSYKFSPHRFVENWNTPIMIIQGGKDFRVPESQGFMAFNAAQIKGVPSKFLYFPEENHWVLKPQNGILWQRSFFEWLDQWLK